MLGPRCPLATLSHAPRRPAISASVHPMLAMHPDAGRAVSPSTPATFWQKQRLATNSTIKVRGASPLTPHTCAASHA
eukprot:scaffold17419_cov54-Phaeocystis_antarctica.AAC.3